MCSRWACLAGGHVLQVFGHLVDYFFLPTVSFVCSETCFQRIYCLNILLVYVGSFMWSSLLT